MLGEVPLLLLRRLALLVLVLVLRFLLPSSPSTSLDFDAKEDDSARKAESGRNFSMVHDTSANRAIKADGIGMSASTEDEESKGTPSLVFSSSVPKCQGVRKCARMR